MVVMFNLTDPVEREHAMANGKATPARLDWKAVLTSDDEDGFRALLQTVVQEVLEAEMTEALQAEKGERTVVGSGIGPAITAASWRPGSVSWCLGFRRTGRGAMKCGVLIAGLQRPWFAAPTS